MITITSSFNAQRKYHPVIGRAKQFDRRILTAGMVTRWTKKYLVDAPIALVLAMMVSPAAIPNSIPA